MKILSLFSGIGAFEKALTNIGIDYELVNFCEIDKYAAKSYCAIHNVNESLNLGDITKIKKEKLPRFIDMITHGSPCQDFSIAGKQAGGNKGTETRSSLMWNTVDIVEWCLPKYVIWENVKNLLSKKHKHNFDSYIEIMDKLGYNSYYQVLNAKDYGIPQNRERVYTISIRKDIDKGDFVFPEKEELKLRLKDMLENEVDEKYYLSDEIVSKFIKNESDNTNVIGSLQMDKWQDNMKRIYNIEKYSPTISTYQGGNTEPKIIAHSSYVSKKYEEFIEDKGYIPEMFNPYNITEIKDIAPTQSTCCGSTTSSATVLIKENNKADEYVIKPKIIAHNIPQKVKVRKYAVDTEKLVELLRNAKLETNITNSRIAFELNIPVTKAEHWFRNDNCFSIPEPEIWLRLKSLLNIKTDEFDESIMTFEEKDGVYDKANRLYDVNGLAPTLTQQEEKVITNRIRKLTPKECWRLMGFSDEDFEKAAFTKDVVYIEGGIQKCNAKLKVVKEKQRHTDMETYVLCTTKDETEQECQEKIMKTFCISKEQIEKIQNVNIAIELLEDVELKECATNTIKCGDYMEMLYMLIKNLEQHHMAIIELEKEDNMSIGKYMRITSEENLNLMKSYIISILIKQIIVSKICGYTNQKMNIQGNIAIITDCKKNLMKMKLSNLKMEFITRLNSNTTLYKQARKFNLCTSFRKNIY